MSQVINLIWLWLKLFKICNVTGILKLSFFKIILSIFRISSLLSTFVFCWGFLIGTKKFNLFVLLDRQKGNPLWMWFPFSKTRPYVDSWRHYGKWRLPNRNGFFMSKCVQMIRCLDYKVIWITFFNEAKCHSVIMTDKFGKYVGFQQKHGLRLCVTSVFFVNKWPLFTIAKKLTRWLASVTLSHTSIMRYSSLKMV